MNQATTARQDSGEARFLSPWRRWRTAKETRTQADYQRRHSAIRRRLERYDDLMLDYLEPMVQRMLKEQDELANVIDRKATTILAFAGTLLGALIPWLIARGTPREWQTTVYLYALAVLFGIAAAFLSFEAQRARRGWSEIRLDSIFPKPEATPSSPLAAAGLARRFWLDTTYGTYEARANFCRQKGRRLLAAQFATMIAVALIGVATAATLWFYRDAPPRPSVPFNQVADVALDRVRLDVSDVRKARVPEDRVIAVVRRLLDNYDGLRGLVVAHHHPLA